MLFVPEAMFPDQVSILAFELMLLLSKQGKPAEQLLRASDHILLVYSEAAELCSRSGQKLLFQQMPRCEIFLQIQLEEDVG